MFQTNFTAADMLGRPQKPAAPKPVAEKPVKKEKIKPEPVVEAVVVENDAAQDHEETLPKASEADSTGDVE